MIDTVASGDHRVAPYLDPLLDLVGVTADELTGDLQEVADDYADQTHIYLDEQPWRPRSVGGGSRNGRPRRHDGHATDMRKFGYSVLTHDAEHHVGDQALKHPLVSR